MVKGSRVLVIEKCHVVWPVTEFSWESLADAIDTADYDFNLICGGTPLQSIMHFSSLPADFTAHSVPS